MSDLRRFFHDFVDWPLPRTKVTVEYHYEEGFSYAVIDDAWNTNTTVEIQLADSEREQMEEWLIQNKSNDDQRNAA